jgi:hypothetical protein
MQEEAEVVVLLFEYAVEGPWRSCKSSEWGRDFIKAWLYIGY